MGRFKAKIISRCSLKKRYIFFLTIISSVIIYALAQLMPVSLYKNSKCISVQKGWSASKISAVLEREGVIRSRTAFKILSKVRGGQFMAGEYELSPSMTPWRIIAKIKTGKVFSRPVTIPEGYTLRQISKLLESKGLAVEKNIARLCVDPVFIKTCGLDVSSLEGYLFPSTYYITRDMQEKEILQLMVKELKKTVAKNEIDKEITEKKMNLFDVIRLASIIEREAETDFDRPLIASVFTNRLNAKMKLESCATVVYAFNKKEMDKNRLTNKDLTIDSPYNTYLHYGLPPGPICNPGLRSIKAALAPQKTKKLFFVLNTDGSRSHIFSETWAEHQTARKTVMRKGEIK